MTTVKHAPKPLNTDIVINNVGIANELVDDISEKVRMSVNYVL